MPKATPRRRRPSKRAVEVGLQAGDAAPVHLQAPAIQELPVAQVAGLPPLPAPVGQPIPAPVQAPQPAGQQHLARWPQPDVQQQIAEQAVGLPPLPAPAGQPPQPAPASQPDHVPVMDNEDTVIDALRIIQSDIKEMKADIRSLKEFQSMKQSSTVENSATERVLHFLQRANQPSDHETVDMSDTTSTVSVGSSGSEDERIKISVFKRKCLAEAIQRFFIHVLRRIPFEGIVDEVVADQLLSVVESECCRELSAKDDKMRCLIRTVMDKDFETMVNFLKLIGKYDPELQLNILSTFRELGEDGQAQKRVTKLCTVCLIKDRVSIKVVCDHYFTHGLLSSELHRDVTHMTSAKAKGLWQRLFQELSKERTEIVLNIMKEILQDGEGEEILHHLDIIKSLERDIQRHRKSLKCRCETSGKGPLPQASHTNVTCPVAFDFILTEQRPFEFYDSPMVAARRGMLYRRHQPFTEGFVYRRRSTPLSFTP